MWWRSRYFWITESYLAFSWLSLFRRCLVLRNCDNAEDLEWPKRRSWCRGCWARWITQTLQELTTAFTKFFKHLFGRIIGCRSSYCKLSEAVTWPHALTSPFWSNLPRAQDTSDSSSGILQKNTCAEYKLSRAVPRRQRPGPLDGPRKAVIVGHKRGPAMLYLIWNSDPGNPLASQNPWCSTRNSGRKETHLDTLTCSRTE